MFHSQLTIEGPRTANLGYDPIIIQDYTLKNKSYKYFQQTIQPGLDYQQSRYHRTSSDLLYPFVLLYAQKRKPSNYSLKLLQWTRRPQSRPPNTLLT